METESITKLLIKFSIPAIVGMFVNALYNVVDRIYIGNIKDIGHLGITGIGVVFPVVILKWNKNKALSLTKALAISNGVGKINFGSNPRFPQTCQIAIKIIILIKLICLLIKFFIFPLFYWLKNIN